MSLADNKRNVFTTIGSYTSLIEETKKPLQTDLFSSINNKRDSIPFLLDVMKTVAGTEALKETIGGMFTKLIDDIEPKLKEALKKQFIQPNADDLLPTTGTNFKDNGITVPVKDIDVSGKFKIDPASEMGNLLYDPTPDSNFNTVAYTAISTENEKIFSNMSIKYISSTDNLQIKPYLSGGGNVKIGDYFNQNIDDAVLINKKEIMSEVMDVFYGTLAKKQNKTIEQNYNELEIGLQLEQLFNDNDSFEISQKDLDALLEKARELTAGIVTYDMGCGIIVPKLQFNDLNNIIKNISGSTDPFYIGNQFEASIDQSTTGDTLIQTTTEKNKQTIKDGFFQKIINIFTIKLLESVTTAPQIRVLLGMMSSLQNEGVVKLEQPNEDMKYFKTTIKCMTNEIKKSITKFIFELVVSDLKKLLKPIILKVLKEKINQYTRIMISLTSVLKI